MALIRRIARLFKTDMHGILEQLEDPRAVLAQAVRDMESEIERNETNLKEQVRESERLDRCRRESSKRIEEINSQIQLCLKQGNEELSKSAIRRRLEVQRMLRGAEQQADGLSKGVALLEQKIKEQQKQLQSIREKMSIISEGSERFDIGSTCSGGVTRGEATVSDGEVQIAYLAEKEQLNMTSARK